MFYPQEMSNIELILPEKLIVKVMEVLADSGNFHQIDASYMSTKYDRDKTAVQDWGKESHTFAAMERRLSSLMEKLKIEKGIPQSDISPDIDSEQIIFHNLDSSSKCNGLVERVS